VGEKRRAASQGKMWENTVISKTDQPGAVEPTDPAQIGGLESRSPAEVGDETEEEFIKISANLPASVVDILRQVAKLRRTTMTEVLKHAISLEKFLTETHREGGKFLIERKDKSVVQVLDRNLL
jgi:hypothetical protein